MTVISRMTATATSTQSGLAFEYLTSPHPLKVSPAAGDLVKADLTIVASRNAGTALQIAEFSVKIPTGNLSAELAANLTGVTVTSSVTGWTSSLSGSTYTFTPTGEYVQVPAGQGMSIQFFGLPINREVGNAKVIISEISRAEGTTPWKEAENILDVGKFPAEFFLRDFKPHSLVVDNGAEVIVSWDNSSIGRYFLLYGTQPEFEIPADRKQWTVPSIEQTTVFYLRGVIGTGSGDTSLTLSTTVTVNKPNLTVSNLTVEGIATVQGELSVTGQLSANGVTRIWGTAQKIEFETAMNSRCYANTDGIVYLHLRKGGFSPRAHAVLTIGNPIGAISAPMFEVDSPDNVSVNNLTATFHSQLIQKGSHFQLGGYNMQNVNGRDSWLVWVPLGKGTLDITPAAALTLPEDVTASRPETAQ